MNLIQQLQISFRINTLKSEAFLTQFLDLPGGKAEFVVLTPAGDDYPAEVRVELQFMNLRDYAVRALLHKLRMFDQWSASDVTLCYVDERNVRHSASPAAFARTFTASVKAEQRSSALNFGRVYRDSSKADSGWMLGVI